MTVDANFAIGNISVCLSMNTKLPLYYDHMTLTFDIWKFTPFFCNNHDFLNEMNPKTYVPKHNGTKSPAKIRGVNPEQCLSSNISVNLVITNYRMLQSENIDERREWRHRKDGNLDAILLLSMREKHYAALADKIWNALNKPGRLIHIILV